MRFAFVWTLLVACGGMQTGQPLQSRQDVDHDGVPDVVDKCAYEPGPEVNSGCPLDGRAGAPPPVGGGGSDRDNDGVPDAVDRCPREPEDRDGFEDEDGCPDPDNDRDGVADLVDRCPLEPARTRDGCPDVNAPPPVAGPGNGPPPRPTGGAGDQDGDGIPDGVDLCPTVPEDRDGVDDGDGCPELDNDSDGVPDAADKCPNLPETKNGKDDSDGCPD